MRNGIVDIVRVDGIQGKREKPVVTYGEGQLPSIFNANYTTDLPPQPVSFLNLQHSPNAPRNYLQLLISSFTVEKHFFPSD